MLAVRALQLVQRFGPHVALGPLDLEIRVGEHLAVLGDNGAGKTTLLRMLGTLARPAMGRLELWGLDAARQRDRLRTRLGYVGHEPGHAPLLTALENLEFFCTLHGLERERATEMLDLVGLEGAAKRRAADLSRGMRQRLALGRALLPDPELLVLDEPEAGLDQQGRALLGRILDGRTAIVASHDWPLSRRLCDRALLLRAGRDAGDPFALEVVAGAQG